MTAAIPGNLAPQPPAPLRILFVFAWLVVGGEETEVRLLAENLDPAQFRIDVVACFRKPEMPEQTHEQLRAAGVRVDTTPYALDFGATISYLASIVPAYDVVVSCQNVADIYPALERLHLRPPLMEHGGLVSEALAGPKHFTKRYVGVCDTIRDAAAGRMPGREHHALKIPSMVDLSSFDPAHRAATRAQLGIAADDVLVGWVGRLDAKKRVEDFIDAAALLAGDNPSLRFVVIGGPDAFMPEYAAALHARAENKGLGQRLRFLGDRKDIPELLSALDIFVWLSRGEGMPHVIAEAGAAGLPVIATPDNGALEQIADGVSGLFVPHEDPPAVARAIARLAADEPLRQRLGAALRQKIEAEYSTAAVIPQWERLFAEVAAERTPQRTGGLFASPVLGGFECSSHRRAHDRERRDMIALSQHDRRAGEHYRLAASLGMSAVRDGLRWHLIEQQAGVYDWSSAEQQLAAARECGMTVIWDIMHYGYPDWLDLWDADFAPRFTAFALAAADRISRDTRGPMHLCPINEISFFAWGGGDVGYLNPFAHGRGHELKVQLSRAAIMATRAIRKAHPDTRFFTCEPMIHVFPHPHDAASTPHAEGHRHAQYQAFDMIAGYAWPQIGGEPSLLDVVGVNFYHNNQWVHGQGPIAWTDPHRRPLRDLLAEVYARYGRPLMISETGIEGDEREAWIDYVGSEVAAAIARGVPVEGICLYPVLGHVGWDDERYCPNGPIDMTADGQRTIHSPSRAAIARVRRTLEGAVEPAAGDTRAPPAMPDVRTLAANPG
ncbi:glycosyltransferase [Qipengyuania sp.]|uniref:glycosyltransferase n=1 Tax=Qipengyuania sp. TaxID=2004515 RepID=UPI0037365276